MKRKPLSEETKRKISESKKGSKNPMYGKKAWNSGKKMSKEHCKKLSEAHKGQVGYWKGKKRPPFSDELKEKMRIALTGRKITWADKLRKPKSEEHKRNISLSKLGNKNPNWKGGVYEDKTTSPAYRRFRISVLKRDNYICKRCGSKNKLNVHHIKPKKDYEHLIFDVNNGITLCEKCHKYIHRKLKN